MEVTWQVDQIYSLKRSDALTRLRLAQKRAIAAVGRSKETAVG